MMVLTKLLNIRTYQLEQYDIAHLPFYAAVSHTWMEHLFPISSLNSITDTTPNGMRMLLAAFRNNPLLKGVDYCWIDTWCIDQIDEADKMAQIPQMAVIYKNAVAVPITIRYNFSFSQQDWDNCFFNLREDIDWHDRLIHDKSRLIRGKELSRLNHMCESPYFKTATRYLIEIGSMPWNFRIWTG